MVEQLPDPEVWVDRYGDYLYRYALHRVRDPALAEELVQDTFLAALDSRVSFAGRSSPESWLVGILKHKVIDHIRKKSREETVEHIEETFAATEKSFDENGRWKRGPAEWNINPGALFEQKEFMEVLGRCVADLPSRISDAFILREMEELGTEEICKILDVTSTNLGVMLYRARMRLRSCLETTWFEKKDEE
ncbi:MAG: RNA polymerase factor sigma-70 [Candidatus Abyssubacteria bacterium]